MKSKIQQVAELLSLEVDVPFTLVEEPDTLFKLDASRGLLSRTKQQEHWYAMAVNPDILQELILGTEEIALHRVQVQKQPDYADIIIMLGIHAALGCTYFAKDANGEIRAYNKLPKKSSTYWSAAGIPNINVVPLMCPLKHLSWSDEEPYHFKPEEHSLACDIILKEQPT